MSTMEDERADLDYRLRQLEAKVDRLLEVTARAEQAFAGFITGPGVARMFRALRG